MEELGRCGMRVLGHGNRACFCSETVLASFSIGGRSLAGLLFHLGVHATALDHEAIG